MRVAAERIKFLHAGNAFFPKHLFRRRAERFHRRKLFIGSPLSRDLFGDLRIGDLPYAGCRKDIEKDDLFRILIFGKLALTQFSYFLFRLFWVTVIL